MIYETKRVKESKPLSKEMREGREPLRTFGDLKRYLQPEPELPQEPPGGKKKRRQEPKPAEEPVSAAIEPQVEASATVDTEPHGGKPLPIEPPPAADVDQDPLPPAPPTA